MFNIKRYFNKLIELKFTLLNTEITHFKNDLKILFFHFYSPSNCYNPIITFPLGKIQKVNYFYFFILVYQQKSGFNPLFKISLPTRFNFNHLHFFIYLYIFIIRQSHC
ncbi:hypothetical protein [Bacillus phage FI_KG-Lek]|nr:hypothetical protein [Bacillus phage FI_KG-Lek]